MPQLCSLYLTVGTLENTKKHHSGKNVFELGTEENINVRLLILQI